MSILTPQERKAAQYPQVETLYLIDVVQVGSLIRPVVVALLHPTLDERRQHDNDHAAVLPHHLQTEDTQ